MASAMVLSVGAWAQEGGVQELRQAFVYTMRVAETPCPEALAPEFPEATCYRHGYDNFFDFKEALKSFVSGPEYVLEPWRVVPITSGGETTETFRGRYRLEENLGHTTLAYISENLLVLTGDVRASP